MATQISPMLAVTDGSAANILRTWRAGPGCSSSCQHWGLSCPVVRVVVAAVMQAVVPEVVHGALSAI